MIGSGIESVKGLELEGYNVMRVGDADSVPGTLVVGTI